MTISNFISKAWRKRKLPVMNGLAKSDGSFYAIRVEDYRPVAMDYQSRIFDINRENHFEWRGCFCDLPSSTHMDVTYHYGKENHGSDSFILAINSNHEVEWLFFDSCAEPFENYGSKMTKFMSLTTWA